MSYTDLGRLVKTKFPQYNDFSDEELGKKVYQKYPEYKDIVEAASYDRGERRNPFIAAASAIDNVYEMYKKTPAVRLASGIVGSVVGVTGGAIGTGVAVAGTPIANEIENISKKGLVKGSLETIKNPYKGLVKGVKDTAASTARFGYDIGKEGTAAAPLGAAGKAVTIPLAYSQGVHGIEDVYKGIKENDPEQALMGGIELGTAVLGARSAIKSKGLFLNKDFLPKSETKLLDEAETLARKDLNIPKGEKKKSLIRSSRATAANREYQDPVRTMVEEGIYPTKKVEGGRVVFDVSKQLDEVNQKESLANDVFEHSLKQNDPNPKHSISQLKDRAISSYSSNSPVATRTGRARLADYFDEAAKQYGEYVDDATLNKLKRGLYAEGYSSDIALPKSGEPYRVAGSILMKEIENRNPNLNIRQVSQVLGRYAELRKFLPSLQGGVAKGGALTTRLSGVVGSIAGRSAGIPVLGEVLGYKVGEYASLLSSISGKTEAEISRLLRFSKASSGKALGSFSSTAKASEQARQSRKLLPAPAIQSNPAPREMPMMSQSEIVQELRSRGVKGPLTAEEMPRRFNPIVPRTY